MRGGPKLLRRSEADERVNGGCIVHFSTDFSFDGGHNRYSMSGIGEWGRGGGKELADWMYRVIIGCESEDMRMWEWLETLPPGSASFLGSLIGSGLGLIALLIGAMFNAHLTRRRDDRLRDEERRGVATALHAELARVVWTLERNAEELKTAVDDFIIRDIAQSVLVFPEMVSKITMFDTETIQKVIDAHIVIEQYREQLTIRGGVLSSQEQTPGRRLIAMKGEKAKTVSQINEHSAKMIREAVLALGRYV
jgi:hypothetical protein